MGESGRFRDYERLIFRSSESELEHERFQCLQGQIAGVRKVQRSHKDRIALTFFNKTAPRHPEDGWVEILRGKVRLNKSTERPVNFRAWMWNGIPLKIEFSRSPRFLEGGDLDVTYTPKPWKRRKELTEIVDQQEHGPNPERADAEDARLERS